ncbi:MAG: hypothetical protein HONBIEJF_02572 [Fimbriimonadaceae bacterium]|nr:hypothetical protein [Fimbriimonadaceae bacterium]
MSLRLAVAALAALFPGLALSQDPPPQQLTLAGAVGYAMKHSPAVAEALAEADAAAAMSRAARAQLSPQASLNGFAASGDMESVLRSTGVEPASMVIAPTGAFFDANLMLMVPIYTGGVLSGMAAAAVSAERAALAELADARSEVALQVKRAYLSAVLGGQLVLAEQSRLAASEEMVRVARAQLEAGKGIEASIQRAEAERAEAQLATRSAENERQKLVLDLLAEMGAPLDATAVLTDSLEFQPIVGTLSSFLTSAKATRGELLAARERVRAAQGRLTSARGSQMPQVYGFAMGDTFAPRGAMGRSAGYTFGISVSVPLFDSGLRRAEVDAARAEVKKIEAEAAGVELKILKEVRQAWLDVETAAENHATAQASLAAAQSAFEVIRVRVEAGKAILVEQLDALARLTSSRANLARALFEHEIAIARLDRAVGVIDGRSQGGKS